MLPGIGKSAGNVRDLSIPDEREHGFPMIFRSAEFWCKSVSHPRNNLENIKTASSNPILRSLLTSALV
ncbi:Uncharacterized protein dnm_043200 [Desulfonema magnum]|uniref:Uncharacterized protein n=1 Tax=Desulfonema magnum TaxID=45655 RepID=A0A975BN75_9BACT|nr:Uncharacterized protein dnm_043200 [Desulfonema magnum]